MAYVIKDEKSGRYWTGRGSGEKLWTYEATLIRTYKTESGAKSVINNPNSWVTGRYDATRNEWLVTTPVPVKVKVAVSITEL